MIKDENTIALEAAVLCCGYNMGFFHKGDIEHWAEKLIEACDDPSTTILDLAMIGKTNPIDVMNLLRSLSTTIGPEVFIMSQIGFIGLRLIEKKITVREAIGGLWSLIRQQGITKEEEMSIYCIDDGCDLALAGTYGTISDVESEFFAFVTPYAQKLQSEYPEILDFNATQIAFNH